ncbi:hypothetical protein [Paraburkholderia nodosa]|uniref:hypothetical protein n=1 Tax=Paraburkholderia nodosa TaxID=392320 RepID=UPI001377B07D|nr:hypothetical protein [Paraburkholderia nodosa]
MDDLVVETEREGAIAHLDLQIKTTVVISSSNDAFRDVIDRARQTRATAGSRSNAMSMDLLRKEYRSLACNRWSG